MVRIKRAGIKFQFMLNFLLMLTVGWKNMQKISYLGIFAILLATPAMAYDADKFRAEVLEGVDLVGARNTIDNPDPAPGALGLDVYQTADAGYNSDVQVFVPTSMYMRAGAGLNLPFATDQATFNGEKFSTAGSWTTQIGLGWNLSSYVRTELDFQESTFEFSDISGMDATYQTIGGMLYFDFARRYVQMGDITYRRRFVPFMGLGASAGFYRFSGPGGADGFVIGAPRAALGFNVMLNELIGIDIMYQYQMMIGNGFGWDVRAGGVDNISNIMASFRVNF